MSDDLFSAAAEERLAGRSPLAARLRPTTLDDVVGQAHLLAPGKPLRALIEGDRLDQVRVFLEDLPDLEGDLPVAAEVWAHPDGPGTQPQGRPHRHGRAYPKGTGLVGGRGDHTAALGIATDHDGPPPEPRIIPLLDGGVERVHVDVDDLAVSAHLRGPPGWTPSKGRALTSASLPSTDSVVPGRQ